MSVIEFSDQFDNLCSSVPISLLEYTKFWENLHVNSASPTHFAIVLIAKVLYFSSGQYKNCPFLEFLFRTSSPKSLLPADMRYVAEIETDILFLNFKLIVNHL